MGGCPWEGAAPEHQRPVSLPPAHTARTQQRLPQQPEVAGRVPAVPADTRDTLSVTLTPSTEASGRLATEGVKPRRPRRGSETSASTRG